MNFFSTHLPCICRPREKNISIPGVTKISTLDLKNSLKDIPESKKLNTFLDSIPLGSNYSIYFASQCTHYYTTANSFVSFLLPWNHGTKINACNCCGCGNTGIMFEKNHNGTFRPSKITIRKHIETHGLDQTCELVLSDYHVKLFNKLKIRKNNHTYNGSESGSMIGSETVSDAMIHGVFEDP